MACRDIERVGYLDVKTTAEGRTERLVRHLADLVVAEVIGVPALLTDDAAPPQLVQRPDDIVAEIRVDVSHDVAIEGPPDDGSRADELSSRGRQLAETDFDDGLHLGRERRR